MLCSCFICAVTTDRSADQPCFLLPTAKSDGVQLCAAPGFAVRDLEAPIRGRPTADRAASLLLEPVTHPGLLSRNVNAAPAPESRICQPELRVPCNRPYSTTAKVFDANDDSSLFTCYPANCGDGCCFVFDPSERLDLKCTSAIVGWVVLGITGVLSVYSWFLSHGCCGCGFANYRFWDRIEAEEEVRRAIRRFAIGTFGLGAAMTTACLLYGGTRNQALLSGIQLGPAMVPFCKYVWVTSAVAFFIAILTTVGDIFCQWRDACKYDMSTGAAAAVAALLLVCYMPLIGGWDTTSGIAFTDVPPGQQGFFNNSVRCTSLVSASNSLVSITVGILLYGQTNIIFGILAR